LPNEYIDGGPRALFQQSRIPLPNRVDVAFLGVDPTAVSLRSALGMSLIYFTEQRKAVIAGLFELTTDAIEEIEVAINQFISHIRALSTFKDTVIIPIVECNNGAGCQIIHGFFNDSMGTMFRPTFGNDNNIYGPLTKNSTKMAWALTARREIYGGLLRFAQPLITLRGGGKNPIKCGFDDVETVDTLREQLKVYRFEKTPSGELTANGKGLNKKTKDDLMDAVLIGVYNGRTYTQDHLNASVQKLRNAFPRQNLKILASETAATNLFSSR
jgi:hypothetical protein